VITGIAIAFIILAIINHFELRAMKKRVRISETRDRERRRILNDFSNQYMSIIHTDQRTIQLQKDTIETLDNRIAYWRKRADGEPFIIEINTADFSNN
jgi:hypothetical protein